MLGLISLLPLLLGWQLQGGNCLIQMSLVPDVAQQATFTVQGDGEDSDNFQPAMGYNVLDSTGQPIAELSWTLE